MKQHPVFHESLLEKVPRNARVILEDLEPDPEAYEVEKIVGFQVSDGRQLYRVRWKNYSEEHDTWEPLTNLSRAKMAIRDFHRANRE